MKLLKVMPGLVIASALLVSGCGAPAAKSYDSMSDFRQAVESATGLTCDDAKEEKGTDAAYLSCKSDLRLGLYSSENAAEAAVKNQSELHKKLDNVDWGHMVQGANWYVSADADTARKIHDKLGGDLYDGK